MACTSEKLTFTVPVYVSAVWPWAFLAVTVSVCGVPACAVPEPVTMIDVAEGALGRMHVSAVAGLMPGPEILLYGSHGTLRFEQQTERLSGAQKPGTELRPIDIPPDKRGGWHVEDDFVAAIQGKQAVRLTTFADGVRYMEFTEAVHRIVKQVST